MASEQLGYQVLMNLGEGGMATIHLAQLVRSETFKKLVVIKVMKPEVASDTSLRRAFLREAQISARLNHQNIVQVAEAAEFDGRPCMAMEYIDGLPFSALIKGGAPSFPLRLQLLVLHRQLVALSYLHELTDHDGTPLGLVHRDVSPQNIMVSFSGAVKLLDFGIAKARQATEDATETGVVKGKLRYMPPEQVLGEPVTAQSDLFSAGAMLWEAAVGRRLWGGMGEGDVLSALVNGAIRDALKINPNADPELCRIAMKALAPKPKDRYSTALEMLLELESAIAKLGGLATERELADFMDANYGQLKLARRQAIEKALSEGTSLSNPGMFRPQTDQFGYTNTDAQSTAAADRRRGRYFGLWVAAAALLLVVTGVGALMVFNGRSAAAASAEPAPRSSALSLSVAATPATATILINGDKVENPGLREFAPRTKVVVEIFAPGHEPQKRELIVSSNISLVMTLTPSAAAPTQASANASAAATGAPSAGPVESAANRAATAANPALPAKPRIPSFRPTSSVAPKPEPAQANCNPPFRIDADGTKVFRPECLK